MACKQNNMRPCVERKVVRTVVVLGDRSKLNVGTKVERLLEEGGGKGVVDDHNAVLVLGLDL